MKNGRAAVIGGAALVAVLGVVLAGTLGGNGGSADAEVQPEPVAAEGAATAVAEVAGGGPEVTVFKRATCLCCSNWAEHMRENGFEVTEEASDELLEVKREHGVPLELAACHTALIDGYVFEGHVPADVIRDFLEERPDATGLAVPGMPVGSPGMEGPDPESYEILAFDSEGRTEVFARRPADP